MSPMIATAQICDARGCPAPAQRTMLLHGADFYFCNHHATKIASTFTPALSAIEVAAAVTDDQPVSAVPEHDAVGVTSW